jgi:hypothetical protein
MFRQRYIPFHPPDDEKPSTALIILMFLFFTSHEISDAGFVDLPIMQKPLFQINQFLEPKYDVKFSVKKSASMYSLRTLPIYDSKRTMPPLSLATWGTASQFT